MWVNKVLFQQILDDNKTQSERLGAVWNTCHALQAKYDIAGAQKIRDDLNIDWLRHRVNALEKQNAVLMMKATGVAMPVPEIVPTRPGSISYIGDASGPEFDTMPSFEDSGDEEAVRLGVRHDEAGGLIYGR